MSRPVIVELVVDAEQKAVLEDFALKAYRPELGITWRDVAVGWAQAAFNQFVADHVARQAKPVETNPAV